MKHLKSLNMPIKTVITVSILAVLFVRMDKEVMAQMIGHFQASAWAYAGFFMAAQCILLALRWQYLLNIGKRHLTFVNSVQINLTSQLANLVFITSIGGMVARVALSVQEGATIFKTLIATVFDRLMTIGALVLLAALFMPGMSEFVSNKTLSTLAGYIAVFVVAAAVFGIFALNYVLSRLSANSRLKGRMRYGIRYLRVMINNPILFAKLVFVSISAQLGLFLAVYFLTVSAGVDISFAKLMMVLPVISLVAALPISIGGWGVREGAFIAGLGLFGVPMETAFLISIQVGLIGMAVNVLLGLPALLTSDLHLERISAMKQSLARIRF